MYHSGPKIRIICVLKHNISFKKKSSIISYTFIEKYLNKYTFHYMKKVIINVLLRYNSVFGRLCWHGTFSVTGTGLLLFLCTGLSVFKTPDFTLFNGWLLFILILLNNKTNFCLFTLNNPRSRTQATVICAGRYLHVMNQLPRPLGHRGPQMVLLNGMLNGICPKCSYLLLSF